MSLPRIVNSKSWVLRPIVLFAATYTIIGILHEVAHALTASALRVPSTLFHLYVHLEPGDGTINERAVIRVAGPVFCLVFGLICWFAYRKAKGSRAELLLLYLAWFGVGTFFGNLMGTPYVGDFSALALAFDSPMPARYAAVIAGFVSLCCFSFFLGPVLRKWAPVGVSAGEATIGLIVLPATVGTMIAILIFQPMPPGWTSARMGESAFWIFATIGMLVRGKQAADPNQDLGLRWPDLVALSLAIVVVRILASGVELRP